MYRSSRLVDLARHAAVHGGACLHADVDEAVQEWLAWLNAWRAAVRAQEWPEAERQAAQRAVNPCYIPRQHLLQRAIDAANDDDYAPLNALLEVLQRPFEEQAGRDDFRQPPPPEMVKPGISQLSCSS